MFVIIFSIVSCTFLGIMAVPRSITEFFPTAEGNLTKISWSHAVNSKILLQNALSGPTMMLEADIMMGKLNTSRDTQRDIPIMAHPPTTISDLSLAEFINAVQEYNTNTKDQDRKKGIKLDFKSIEVFEASLNLLEEKYPKINFPLWINADILPGPHESTTVPVDPSRFLSKCKRFPNATLSIGWTTNYVKDIVIKYTLKQVEDMFDVIKYHSIEQPITIPIRATFVAASFKELKELLFVLPPGSTITIWHATGDSINPEELNMVINSLGVARVFIDLPQHLLDVLHLDS